MSAEDIEKRQIANQWLAEQVGTRALQRIADAVERCSEPWREMKASVRAAREEAAYWRNEAGALYRRHIALRGYVTKLQRRIAERAKNGGAK